MNGHHHIVPVRLYLLIFLALMVGTTTTVAVAYVDLGVFNNVVMLTIAIAKATLVVLYFMHVRYSSNLTKVIVAAGVVWLLIMFAFLLGDYLTRHWLGPQTGF